jgi:hypothetical protein
VPLNPLSRSETAVRLPAPADFHARLLASPVGRLVTRPWFDRVALKLGLGAYLPLSRAWAAATVSDGSLARFHEEVPIGRLPSMIERGLPRALARIAELSFVHSAVEREWEAAYFGPQEARPDRLVMAECARRDASDSLMKGRLSFLPMRLQSAVPAVRFDIPTFDQVMARYGTALEDYESAYMPPDTPPAIVESRRVPSIFGTEYWLKFPSGNPAVGPFAWAHVFEPEGVKNPPSLVYGHGLAMEIEAMEGAVEGSNDIITQGVRFIRLEAPWHSRRRLAGRYGGEPFMASPPMGALDLFSAEVREMAALIAWCRSNSSGRVAVGGTSLGALASQLVVTHCRHWPKIYRPDVAFLATTTQDVGSLSFDSSLAKLIKVPQAIGAAGWTREMFDRWRPLTDPHDEPPLDPADIIMVLGRVDTVTPFERGLRMARSWKIPEGNLFMRDAGHFSVSLDLNRDPAPLYKVAARLKR